MGENEMDERPEDLLVEAAVRGGREAFAELVRRHRHRVYGLVFRMAGNHSDADDLAQEVFLTAWRSIASFKRGSSFYTWLYRIAVNASLTFLKKRSREKARVEFSENLAGAAGACSSSPEGSSALGELRARADEAIAALPGHFRASFALVVGQGLSHAEAARVLGCSENTVSWRMHKARKLLQARLKPYLGEVRS
jgi:RNA polymerase sigma-70 factor (ECF subfamily)